MGMWGDAFGIVGDAVGNVGGWIADPLDLLGHRKGEQAAGKQLAAQKEALEQQQQAIAESRARIGGFADQARSDLMQGQQNAVRGSGQFYGDAQGLSGDALANLQGDRAQAAGTAIGAYDVVGQQPNRLGAMLDAGIYGNFEQDPGYQFRREQGEQAINRSAAARGGRLGGAALKELARYNSGLASQEFANYAARQQAAAGLAGRADQQGLAALMNQAGREDMAQLAAQRNQMGLLGMETDIYGQQADRAMTRGQDLADLYTGTAANLGNLAGIGIGAETALTTGGNEALRHYAQFPGMVEQGTANARMQTAGAIGQIVGSRLGRSAK